MNSNTPVDEVLQVLRSGVVVSESGLWKDWDNVREAHRQLFEAHIKTLQTPEYVGHGRGIVTCGGGRNYFPSLWVLLHSLRSHGCSLPIQVWYNGDIEMDPAMRRLLSPMGVTFVNTAAVALAIPARVLRGWALKLYATLYSDFQDVLFLDADIMVCQDVEQLFASPEYQVHGAVFFPDYPTWNMSPGAWDAVRIKPPANCMELVPADGVDKWFGAKIPDGAVIAIETGCFAVDKRRHWVPLALAHFCCQRQDFYFHFLHGDCGSLQIAWHRLGHKYARPDIIPDWDEHTMLQHNFDGQVLFEHRTMDKWRMDGRNRRCKQQKLTQEAAGFQLMGQLIRTWSGSPWHNDQPTTAEALVANRLAGQNFRYKRLGYDERVLQLNPDGSIGRGQAAMEHGWSVFVSEYGLQLALLSSTGPPTCVLTQHADGAWYGYWCGYERMTVTLTPIDPTKEL